MKIEFEKIIELANQRKELLLKVSALLEHAEEHRDNTCNLLGWLIEVTDALKRLDEEGRKMLPPEVISFFLSRNAEQPVSLCKALLNLNSYHQAGLHHVVEAVSI